MIFSEEVYNTIIKCSICNLKLDESKILPCGIYCKNCVSEMIRSKVGDSFRCNSMICGKFHSIPVEGFISWAPMEQLLSDESKASLDSIYRGESVKKLRENLFEIDKKLTQFSSDLSNGSNLVKEHCSKLRNEVQLETEILIQKIQKFNENMINEINEYESKQVSSLEKNNLPTNDFNDFVDETKKFHENYVKYLKNYEIDNSEIEKAIKESKKLFKRFFGENQKLKKNIFNENMIKYEKNNLKVFQNILGSLFLEKIELFPIYNGNDDSEEHGKNSIDDRDELHTRDLSAIPATLDDSSEEEEDSINFENIEHSSEDEDDSTISQNIVQSSEDEEYSTDGILQSSSEESSLNLGHDISTEDDDFVELVDHVFDLNEDQESFGDDVESFEDHDETYLSDEMDY